MRVIMCLEICLVFVGTNAFPHIVVRRNWEGKRESANTHGGLLVSVSTFVSLSLRVSTSLPVHVSALASGSASVMGLGPASVRTAAVAFAASAT